MPPHPAVNPIGMGGVAFYLAADLWGRENFHIFATKQNCIIQRIC